MAGDPALIEAVSALAPPAAPRVRRRAVPFRTVAVEAAIALASFAAAAALGIVGAFRTSPAAGELVRLRSVESMATFIERAVDSPASGLARPALDQAFGSFKGAGHLPAVLGGYLHASIGPRVAATLGELVDVRLGYVLSAAFVVPLTYLLARASFGRRAALLAATSLLLVPRFAHDVAIGAPDAIVAAAWLSVLVLYAASLRARSPAFGIATGLAFGLALATTSAAAWLLLFVPFHFLLARSAATRRLARSGRMPLPPALLWMLLVGPATLVAASPWLWHDAVPRLRDLVVASLAPSIAPALYRGSIVAASPVPKGYALELFLFVLPATTLALALAGGMALASRAVRRAWDPPRRKPARDRAAGGALVSVGLAFALALPAIAPDPLLVFPPRVDLALPFAAIAAGVGLDRALGALARLFPSARRLVPAAACLLLAPAAFSTLREPSTASAAFSPLAGGARRVGALRTFATNDGTALRPIAIALDRLGRSEVALYAPDVPADVWEAMRAFGQLRRPVRIVPNLASAELVVVTETPGGQAALRALHATSSSPEPLATVARDGARLVALYRSH